MADIDFLKKDEVKKFIQSNLNTDLNKLILNPPKELKSGINLIADQILARRKAKGKLDRWINNPDLLFPPPLSVEQSSSSMTASYKATLMKGKHLIDLTGGMGIDSLALSNQFEATTYVEKQSSLCDLFSHNQLVLGQNIEVVNASSEQFVQAFNGQATFFIDPARRDTSKNKVFRLEECSPNLIELMDELREKADQVMVKLSPLLDLSSLLNEIPNISEIHIVSVKNDCKELLVRLDFKQQNVPQITCVNLASKDPLYHFTMEQERHSIDEFSLANTYLYEPNASILKAGAFKTVGQNFRLKKLAKHTHLYTSDKHIENFPGRVFKVVGEGNKKNIKNIAGEGLINVITRNYPIDPSNLKKKYGIKDGGNQFLIGYRDLNDKPLLLIADRVDL